MLLLTNLLLAALFSPAYAVDTSGCSQHLETAKTVNTKRSSVEVVFSHPPRENCWNADQAFLRIQYRLASNARVAFWVSLNGRSETLDAAVSCREAGPFYGKDTSTPRLQTCVATLTLPTRAGRQELELAPIVDGEFDTVGFGENARLSF